MNSPCKSGTALANPTVELVERICAVTFDGLDRDTVAVVKCLISDGVAVAIAGSVEAAPRIVAEHVRDMGCSPQASVWGFALKTSPMHAALANAVSMHVLDFEPMSSPPTHAVSPTVPVAGAQTTRSAQLLGATVALAVGSSPEQLAATIKSEMTRLGKVIRDAGIRE